METEMLSKVEQLAYKKRKIYNQSITRYLLRAILASFFIGFGVVIAFRTGNFFYAVESPFAYPAAAITFGAAILMISYAGGDLFTGDTFYFSFASLRKKQSWGMSFKMMGLSYLGNFIGALIFALLVLGTHLYADHSTNEMLISVATTKLSATTTAIFFKAILCNWLVCLAFFIPLGIKSDGAKMFIMMLLVFCFFASGYEHSIANMSVFAISIVSQPWGTFTAGQILHNMIPATLGNFIGGAVFMAMLYYYLNKPYFEEETNH